METRWKEKKDNQFVYYNQDFISKDDRGEGMSFEKTVNPPCEILLRYKYKLSLALIE